MTKKKVDTIEKLAAFWIECIADFKKSARGWKNIRPRKKHL